MTASVVITGIGALTPVGAGAAQTCASVRAGLCGLVRHPSYYPIFPDPISDDPQTVSCGVAVGDVDARGRDARIVEMAVAAMRELIRAARLNRSQTLALEVVLCLPESGHTKPAVDSDGIAQELQHGLGITFAKTITVAKSDQPGAFGAMHDAVARMRGGGAERCLVVAADSFVGEAMLQWLDEHDRLRSDRNADGFLPGEAAACFLLERADVATARGASVFATVAGVGLGDEPNTVAGDANSTGVGLCQAMRAASCGFGAESMPWAIGDMNGESYGAYEWGVASSRLGLMLGATTLWHPADCMGAVGAAASALCVVLACRAFATGYAPDDRVLLWCSSDSARRAACVLCAPASPSSTTKGRKTCRQP